VFPVQLILIVEDEYGSAEVLQLLLETHGYRVASASNGSAALDLLAGERPAVILSDFMMPHMNGAELGACIRRNAGWSEIPFVFISGTSEPVVQAAFKDYDRFLPKPTDVDLLLSTVGDLATNGRRPPARSQGVSDSMRHLLKGIEFPSSD
jgi:CheY-like chemotaxis protein